MSYAYVLFGASGQHDDYGSWPVVVCKSARTAELLEARASEEMAAAVAADASGKCWDEISALLTIDPRADVGTTTHYFVKPIPILPASGMEARHGGNEVPSQSDDSPTAATSGGDVQDPSEGSVR